MSTAAFVSCLARTSSYQGAGLHGLCKMPGSSHEPVEAGSVDRAFGHAVHNHVSRVGPHKLVHQIRVHQLSGNSHVEWALALML